jgi:hypothetical protein
VGTSVVRAGDGSKSFLAGGIPLYPKYQPSNPLPTL